MNREMYHQIKAKIQADFDLKMDQLDSLATYMGVFNSKAPLKSTPRPPVASPKPEMKLLKEMHANGTNGVLHAPAKYQPKNVPCEFKGCTQKVSPERPKCEICSKKVCSRHQRDKKICSECKASGAA